MKKCLYCGHENADDAPVCVRCWAEMKHEEKHEDKPVKERASKKK